jgi:ribosomal protein S18 acetylase RimI-like enzyme
MTFNLTDTSLAIRSINENDEEVLFKIYAATRMDELEVTGWTSKQKEDFIRQQFTAQHSYYQTNYNGAYFWVIEQNDKPVGRLYLHPNYEKNSMRIIDIALLPEFRSKGIGSAILKDILNLAEQQGKKVSIHVESFNPAKSLYERLGFKQRSITNGVYHLMEYKSATKLAEPV